MSARIGSLFSGYEGLGMGVQAVLGGELAWVSDIDPGACKILAHHYPGVPNLGDITTVGWSQVEPVDILTGGSPCQDLSHAGKRQGMTEGTRSNLWVAMREAIAQLRPRLVIWENVRGAASADATSDLEFCPGCMGDPWDRGPVLRALGRVVGDLADLGYVGGFHGLRAADVGAPHLRFRYFLAAYPERIGQQWRAREPIGSPFGRAAAAGSSTVAGEVALLSTPAVNDMGAGKTVDAWDAWDAWTADMQAKHGNGNGHGKSLAIEAQRLLPTPSVADSEGGHERRGGLRGDELLLNGVAKLLGTPTAAMSQRSEEFADGRESTPAEFAATYDGTWGEYAPAIARWGATLGRPAPAPTMTSAKGNPQLAPAFVEWMMGLPAGWVTDVPGLSRNEMLKALGNGVVPQQAEAALRWLLPQIARVAA